METEQDLIRRVIDGDPQAEEAFVERYQGLVLGLARGRFGLDAAASEDLWQATIERLWEHDRQALRAWRGRGRFTSYLTVIVTHLCLRQRERHARRGEQPCETLDPAWVDPAASADQDLEERERRRLVDEAVGELSARDRLLLALRYDDERSPKDIAQALRIEPGAVRKGLHDALGRLRRLLAGRRPELFAPESEEILRPSFGRRSR